MVLLLLLTMSFSHSSEHLQRHPEKVEWTDQEVSGLGRSGRLNTPIRFDLELVRGRGVRFGHHRRAPNR